MRTGGKRKILVKSGGSKSQPLDTNPRHECSQRGPIGARNTAPPRPDGLRSPPNGGACYRELPRIPLPRTWMNKGKKKGRSVEIRPSVVAARFGLLLDELEVGHVRGAVIERGAWVACERCSGTARVVVYLYPKLKRRSR